MLGALVLAQRKDKKTFAYALAPNVFAFKVSVYY